MRTSGVEPGTLDSGFAHLTTKQSKSQLNAAEFFTTYTTSLSICNTLSTSVTQTTKWKLTASKSELNYTQANRDAYIYAYINLFESKKKKSYK